MVEQHSTTKLLSGVSDLEQSGLKTIGRTHLRCCPCRCCRYRTGISIHMCSYVAPDRTITGSSRYFGGRVEDIWAIWQLCSLWFGTPLRQRLHLNHQITGTVGYPLLTHPVLLTLRLSTPLLQKTPT